MRTDSERLDWLLGIMANPDAPESEHAVDALEAAFTQFAFTGRVAVDAAMGAVVVLPGEQPPKLTGAQLIGEMAAEMKRNRVGLVDFADGMACVRDAAAALDESPPSSVLREILTTLGAWAAILLEGVPDDGAPT